MPTPMSDNHRVEHALWLLHILARDQSTGIEDLRHDEDGDGLHELAHEGHDAGESAFAPPAGDDFIDVGHVVVDVPRDVIERASPQARDDDGDEYQVRSLTPAA